jgi:hypothetical protein
MYEQHEYHAFDVGSELCLEGRFDLVLAEL